MATRVRMGMGAPPWAALAQAAPASFASPPPGVAARTVTAAGTPPAWPLPYSTPPLGWPGMLMRPLAAAGGGAASASGGSGDSGGGSGLQSAPPDGGGRFMSPATSAMWELRPTSALFQLAALRGGRRTSRDSDAAGCSL